MERTADIQGGSAEEDPQARLERLAELPPRAPSRRVLVIVNPYASTVSDRLKHLVVYALRGTFHVDAIDTEHREHATDLCRDAARAGYDAVVAFGGDGTVNEAANGLAGTGVPLTCLPGGRTNVLCRILGIPDDVVDATENLLGLADRWEPRTIDLGRVGERHFTFSAGVGLDARVVERVDAHPRLKQRAGEYYYTWVAARTFARRYLLHPPRLAAELDGETVPGVTVIVQNAAPYTYFGRRRIDMGEGADLVSGSLAGVVLERASPFDLLTVSWRALSSRARIARHRKIHPFTALDALSVVSLDGRPLPVQVDGDYIGESERADFTIVPRGLTIVA